MEFSAMAAPEFCGTDDGLQRQASDLRRTVDELCRRLEGMAVMPAPECFIDASMERQVRTIIQARRARDRFFDSGLFADPAWDMLLELFASGLGGHRTSVTSLCCAAAVPATTALRWITVLQENGLISRKNDPLDGRRSFLTLSSQAHSAMAALFGHVGSARVI